MITSDSPFPYLDESECVLIFTIGKESKIVKIGRPISDRPSGFQTTFSALRGKSLTHVCVLLLSFDPPRGPGSVEMDSLGRPPFFYLPAALF